MAQDHFSADIPRHIWEAKYRFRDADTVHDRTVEDTWRRIADALASVEARDRAVWVERFYAALEGFKFLPGGRIQAGAGTRRRVTLFNCFVMGLIEDSMDGIFDGLKEGALTMQQGGGVGYDFSTLRPRGLPARATGTVASGPVSFMRIWDSMCGTPLSTGARRGAMMATLRCDHPDIEEYVRAKRDPRDLRHFNLSVQVTDEFMQAVRADRDWVLAFPAAELGEHLADDDTVLRRWTGKRETIPCRILRRVRARDLWNDIMRATCDYAEPGVLFVDRINRLNNLWYREYITATNPCGEIGLPPYGACDLGSINLTRFVREPFTANAHLDFDAIRETAATATRMMDNVIDVSQFPLPRQAEQARGTRHLGLGLTGLADTLIMLGLHYGEPAAREMAARTMRTICRAAYETSIALAAEKGPFPARRISEGEFVRALPEKMRTGIARTGIRNSHRTAIAPTGTISLLADNVSSGIELVYDFCYTRRGLDAGNLAPIAHLDMQAALQPYVDNAISKTINVPEDFPFEDFRHLYELAFDKGLKGCTTFRPNPITGAVLTEGEPAVPADQGTHASHCCSIEREAD